MTHEQRAKKVLEDIWFNMHGVLGDRERKEIDIFFHHLKEAIKADIKKEGL